MLLALGFLALLIIIAFDRRPLSDYGLVVDRRWIRHALAGVAAGVGFYTAYTLACLAAGVYGPGAGRFGISDLTSAALSALSAIPLAAAHQVIFSGYLPSVIRPRLGWPLAIFLPALLFGLASALAMPGGLLEPANLRLAAGMALVSLLLCLARLATGLLPFSAGILAGAIMVRRIPRKLNLLEYNPDSPWSLLFAPDSDQRQGIAMWLLLAIISAGFAYMFWRRGERRLPADQPALDASFKRILPFSNLLALAPLDIWIAKLWQARLRIGPSYLPRLIVTLIVSAVNTVLTLPERLLAPLLVRHAVPDPVFIVGVHRSGTTHLHNLLALDPRFCTPRSYQVFNPHGVFTGWPTTLLVMPFLTGRRPMDAMPITALSPQEEDFALAAMTRYAPYWLACFPRLFAAHERFIYPDRMTARERAVWGRQLTLFLRKITFWSRKSPLLKSPYNTARVAALRELFPRAKFIHIVRHPHATWRSNMHLAEHGWVMFQLQNPGSEDSYAARFLTNYRDQEEAFRRDAAGLPESDVAEVRFEDLEADPEREIGRIYDRLGLGMSPAFAQRLEAYLGRIAGYRKNVFEPLAESERHEVDRVMGDFARRWGYDAPESSAAQPKRKGRRAR